MGYSTPIINSYYILNKVLTSLITIELTRFRIDMIIGFESIQSNYRLLNRAQVMSKYSDSTKLNKHNINQHISVLIDLHYINQDLSLNYKGVRLITSFKRLYKIELMRLTK